MMEMASSKMNTALPQTRKSRLWMTVVLGLLEALPPLSIDMYLPALPLLAQQFQADASLAQLSLTSCLFGIAFGQLIFGPASDAWGRRKPLIIGLAAYVAASLLCAATSSIWGLIVLRLIQGIAGAGAIVIASAIISDHFSGREMTKFFAQLSIVNGSVPILAPIMGGALLHFTNWQGVFVVLGILGFCLLIGVVLRLPESLPDQHRTKGGLLITATTMRRLLKDKEFVGYSLTQGLAFAALFAYIAGSPFVLQQVYGVTPQQFSILFAINGIGLIIASLLSSSLSIRFGEKKVLAAGLAIAAAGGLSLLIALVAKAGLVVVLLPMIAIVSSIGLISPASTTLALQHHKQSAGSASALIGVSATLIGAIITPLVGLGGSDTAIPMGVVIVTCAFGALLCYWGMIQRPAKNRQKPR